MVVAIVGVLEEQGGIDQSVLHHWVPFDRIERTKSRKPHGNPHMRGDRAPVGYRIPCAVDTLVT